VQNTETATITND